MATGPTARSRYASSARSRPGGSRSSTRTPARRTIRSPRSSPRTTRPRSRIGRWAAPACCSSPRWPSKWSTVAREIATASRSSSKPCPERVRGGPRHARRSRLPAPRRPPMNGKSEMDELRRREEFAERLGGPERVKRQHDGGRYTIRERITRLVDADSFHEIGKIAGKASYDARNDLKELTPSNFVFGRARIDGRPVVV